VTEQRVQRRLAAILAADVVGYSALMQRAEEATYAEFERLKCEVIEPGLSRHDGRLIKTTGDGALAEFASPSAAVRCAVEIQEGIASGSSSLKLRIGVNLGEVIVGADGDLFGDGINIAVRLEGGADPGGVLISEKVYSEVEGKLDVGFEDRGEQQLKNITKPVRAYAVRAGEHGVPTEGLSAAPRLPDKPSIAVLPFQNMSGDPEQEYFTDGMVEEIITALSRFKQLFVIARNSSFTYKGRAVDVKEVGRELGVRYVLEGSVRKAGGRVRITGQLIEAASGAYLWADRFDGTLEDVFDLQDKVTLQVVGAIAPSVERAEIERVRQKPLVNESAYDWYLRGFEQHNIRTPEAQTKALEMYQRAIKADPRFAAAYAAAIFPYITRNSHKWFSDPSELSEAVRLAHRALELDQDDPYVLAHVGYALATFGGEYERGRGLLEKAIRLNPNLSWAQCWCGFSRMWNGEYRESIANFETFIRLSPLEPYGYTGPLGLAVAYFFLDKPAECRKFAELAVRATPDAMISRQTEILSLVAVNRIDEAKEKFARFARDYPDMADLTGFRRRSSFRVYRDIERVIEAFRLVGLSD
jgi:adenylate cyclase